MKTAFFVEYALLNLTVGYNDIQLNTLITMTFSIAIV
jgi:hypothetical protein